MGIKSKRKAILGTIMATGLAAGATCHAQSANGNNAAGVLNINGREVNVAKIIQELNGQWDNPAAGYDDYRLPVVKYGGPPTFDLIAPVLSTEEIEFGIREIIAEQMQLDIDSVSPSMAIDLVNNDLKWQEIVTDVAFKYVIKYSVIYEQLQRLDAPTVQDLCDIVNREYANQLTPAP